VVNAQSQRKVVITTSQSDHGRGGLKTLAAVIYAKLVQITDKELWFMVEYIYTYYGFSFTNLPVSIYDML
jgi:hypothetical protein